MIASWPEWKSDWNFQGDETSVEIIKEAVRQIRAVRTQMNRDAFHTLFAKLRLASTRSQ